MKIPFLFFVLAVVVVATLVSNKKNPALPYLIGLMFLPDGVNIPLGSVNVWGSDILSAVMFVVIAGLGGFAPPFKFRFVDCLLPAICIYRGICMLVLGEGFSASIQSGFRWFLPWVLPYLIMRMGIKTWDGFKHTIKVFIFVGMFLSALAVVESILGKNIFGVLGFGWNPYEKKFGLWRSHGTFNSIHIFGMFLAIVSTFSMALYCADTKNNKRFLYTFLFSAFGSFCSTASTGWLQALLALGFMLLYLVRSHWKIWVYGFLAVNIFIHFASSRGLHFFYARRMVGMGEAYYRAVLIDTVLARMPGHWIFGQGTEQISLWFVSYEDICNNWLNFMVRTGLPGFIGLILFYTLMMLSLREAYKVLHNFRGERIVLWGVLSVLVSLIVSWFFIALYGSDIGIFSAIFGIVVSLPDLARFSLSGEAQERYGPTS